MNQRSSIQAGQTTEIVGGRVNAVEGEIGAQVGQRFDPQRQEVPLPIQAKRDGGVVIPRMVISDKALGTLAEPEHGTADPLGPNQGKNMLREW